MVLAHFFNQSLHVGVLGDSTESDPADVRPIGSTRIKLLRAIIGLFCLFRPHIISLT